MGKTIGNIPPLAERQMPGLSETLDGPKHPARCQGCAAHRALGAILEHWREHDAWDKPTTVTVTLCRRCSDRMIDPHPRLYSKLEQFRPTPGLMELCELCTRRDGITCTSKLRKSAGGPGLEVKYPRPSFSGFICRSKGAGPLTVFAGEAISCADRDEEIREVSPEEFRNLHDGSFPPAEPE